MKPTHRLKKSSIKNEPVLAKKILVEFYIEPIHLEVALQSLLNRGLKVSKKVIFDEAKYQFYLNGTYCIEMNGDHWPTNETKSLCEKMFPEYYN